MEQELNMRQSQSAASDQAERLKEASLAMERARVELAKRDSYPKKDYSCMKALAAALEAVDGHPLQTLSRENEALTAILAVAREALVSGRNWSEAAAGLRGISVHYAKKGDLLYPLLKVTYGVSGPSDVMWTEDDEIRDEISALLKSGPGTEQWQQRMQAVLSRAEEMISKEQNILFPICAVNFTEEEWQGIYRDSKDYALCFGVEERLWNAAESCAAVSASGSDSEVRMPGGHMTVEQLTALLNTIPMEITFVDDENVNRYFNEGPKVFKRPGMAIDREVFSCHPPKIEPMVRSIIEDFRAGRRSSVPIWMEKGGRSVLVTYMAVRDRNSVYLGTVELVQDMEDAKEHFCK